MSPAPPDADGPLWRFALRFYAGPGIASACLTLQERIGLDVNVLLLSLFAQLERGVALDAGTVAEADGLVAAWRSEVVRTLRGVRTRLKSGPNPAPSALTDGLRQEVKALELRAEQIELAVLERWLDGRLAALPERAPDDAVLTAARHFAAPDHLLAEPEVARALSILAGRARSWQAGET